MPRWEDKGDQRERALSAGTLHLEVKGSVRTSLKWKLNPQAVKDLGLDLEAGRAVAAIAEGVTESAKVSASVLEVSRAVFHALQLQGDVAKEIVVSKPPAGAQQLVAFFAPAKLREQALGCLEEAFYANVALMGPRKAAWSYRYQVLATTIAFLWPRLLGWAGVAAVLKRLGMG